ncbi:MAG: aspartate aminotransferase family protein [Phycisphaerales bacterium]|nr:aspartate aminotransferase family protein [Phycisphaerales bacterium]
MSQPAGRVPLPIFSNPPPAYAGPSAAEVAELRREFVNAGVFHYYKQPLCIVAGRMQYLWDDTGRQYLDAIAGIATVSVGHCHPHVTQRVREQLETLVHATTIYLHPNMPLLARELARRMPAPSGLTSTYFANSGAEANELALLMARLHTGRQDVLTLRGGYHGGTLGTMSLTAVGTWKFPVPTAAGVRHVPPGYCYRCPLGLKYPSCEVRCAKSIEEVIRHETSGEIAGFIAEPIQGVGGVVTPPPEYFRIAFDIVRKFGGLCIADEVQTGFGRTGAHFWGFENWGVVPDAVTVAKGIANGAPLSAVITRREIAQNIAKRVHFSTFGGNPVVTAAGLATLEVMERESVQQRAAEVGAYLRTRLDALAERHALIGEVRGIGLMLGVELVRDRATREPAGAATAAVLELARERGLLLGRGGLFGNVLRIKPPMCLTRDDCDFLAGCLDECLALAAPGA